MKGKIWRKILSVCLVLLMVAALVPTQLFSVSAASGIAYIYRWWDSGTNQVKSETKYAEATKLQYYSSDLQDLYSGWYYSQNYIEFNKRVNIHGTVNIIICEEGGSYVKFKDGIHVSPGDTLNIYGQGAETQALEAFAETNDYAGIGGGMAASCGNITINGGTVTAIGGSSAAGIGCSYWGSCGHITINGGTVTATGGRDAAGIGSGNVGECGNIMVNNTVTKVTATKGSSAPNSIGAGTNGTCSTVTIGGVEGAVSESPYTYQPE